MDIITDRVIEYYKKYYIKVERAKYSVDLKKYVLGGKHGLNILLYNEINHIDLPQIYASNPEFVAHEIANTLYNQTNNMFVHVVTVIGGREYEIKLGTRSVATVYENYSNNMNTIKVNDYTIISPFLQLINILRDYINPTNDRNNNQILVYSLLDKINFAEVYAHDNVKNDKLSNIKDIPHYKKLSPILNEFLHVITTYNRSVYIMAQTCDQFIEIVVPQLKTLLGDDVRIDKHKIALPNEFFMEKIQVKYSYKGSKFSLIFYNNGYYEIFGYNENNNTKFRQAIPSVVLLFTLIEDNSGLSLVKNEKIQFYNKIYKKELIDALKTEVFPDPDQFYGFIRDKVMMKKILIKDVKSYYLYFPHISSPNKK